MMKKKKKNNVGGKKGKGSDMYGKKTWG